MSDAKPAVSGHACLGTPSATSGTRVPAASQRTALQSALHAGPSHGAVGRS